MINSVSPGELETIRSTCCDVVVSGIDVIEIAAKLRESWLSFKISLISGCIFMGIIPPGGLEKETDFLQKSSDHELMLERVAKLLTT